MRLFSGGKKNRKSGLKSDEEEWKIGKNWEELLVLLGFRSFLSLIA